LDRRSRKKWPAPSAVSNLAFILRTSKERIE